jgi:hypothetical protein
MTTYSRFYNIFFNKDMTPEFAGENCKETCNGLCHSHAKDNTVWVCELYDLELCSDFDETIPRCKECVKEFGV